MEFDACQNFKIAFATNVYVTREVQVVDNLTRGIERADAIEIVCARN